MLQVALQSNNHLVLPDAILRQAGIRQDDKFYICYENSEIKLIKIEPSHAQKTSIMDFLGCAKDVYGTTDQEIESYLNNERRSWEDDE